MKPYYTPEIYPLFILLGYVIIGYIMSLFWDDHKDLTLENNVLGVMIWPIFAAILLVIILYDILLRIFNILKHKYEQLVHSPGSMWVSELNNNSNSTKKSRQT